jgi:lysophospholipase L1-like esterase
MISSFDRKKYQIIEKPTKSNFPEQPFRCWNSTKKLEKRSVDSYGGETMPPRSEARDEFKGPVAGKFAVPCIIFIVAAILGGALLCKKAFRKSAWEGHPAFAAIHADPALPNVLIIGDSISIGYTAPVRTNLVGKANVYRVPENAGSSKFVRENVAAWLRPRRWSVIVFNFGLHDLRLNHEETTNAVPLPHYEKNLSEIISQLKTTGARLIWCSTTPVPSGLKGWDASQIEVYNRAANALIRANGIEFVDLHALAVPKLAEIQEPNDVHFNDLGYSLFAAGVSQKILEVIARRP